MSISPSTVDFVTVIRVKIAVVITVVIALVTIVDMVSPINVFRRNCSCSEGHRRYRHHQRYYYR